MTSHSSAAQAAQAVRHDWTRDEVAALYARPLLDLVFEAAAVHRRHFPGNRVQVSTLLSVKTGGCSEDCGYCAQSAHHDTGLAREPLMALEAVVARAREARAAGAGRFCMGAAWRRPRPREFEALLEMVRAVKALGLETCLTAGALTAEQARWLAEAGLDYYNHNLDTSREHYPRIVTTHGYDERLETLRHVREAGLKVCCGGILGLGESREDRIGLLLELARMPRHPESVPINRLVPIAGTPLADAPPLDPFELVRTVAVARILMPRSWIRLSAGRESMSDELQALCFLAGANSVFSGERLLTAPNAGAERDRALFARLGLEPEPHAERAHTGGTGSGPLLYGEACLGERAEPH
ncbi:biotin synthase BioB [Inmirania thermothiophila]|uniref:Biotin synthase n=1 Tax=Inmirania thermothiophila TaxID=1750597 RepID=A0A3N1YA54_9GAMM|nr:biotin synthase BioB [Inmirania thermothiophila]ROR34502.1 biotin synthase [Inmirania thermothiophila]